MKTAATCLVASLVTVSLVSAAAPVTGLDHKRINETALEAFLWECVRNFTIMLTTGIPSMNIPSFDPWQAKGEFPFEASDVALDLKFSGSGSSVESVGFSSVQVQTPNLDTQSSTFNISFVVPDLDILGTYNCFGFHSTIQPIIGVGAFKITLYGVSGHGSATVNFNETPLSLSLIVSDDLKFQNLAASFEQLALPSPGTTQHDRVSVLMANELYNQVQDQFRQQFTQSLTDYLNEELAKYPFKEPVGLH